MCRLLTAAIRNVGTVTVRACGQVIFTDNLYIANQGTPGFNNLPNPAWNVPTAGDCTWSISASGGYVDVRAVTTTYRTTPAPTVDLRVNGSNGPLSLSAPASYTLSWTSTNAASCTASGSWSGAQATGSSQGINNVGGGTYTYTLTCSNPSGSASDSVTVNVLSAPTVIVNCAGISDRTGQLHGDLDEQQRHILHRLKPLHRIKWTDRLAGRDRSPGGELMITPLPAPTRPACQQPTRNERLYMPPLPST